MLACADRGSAAHNRATARSHAAQRYAASGPAAGSQSWLPASSARRSTGAESTRVSLPPGPCRNASASSAAWSAVVDALEDRPHTEGDLGGSDFLIAVPLAFC